MIDALDDVEARGQAARAAVKESRQAPAQTTKRNRGRIQRNRGSAAERWVAKFLSVCLFRRTPMSGALGGRLASDVARLRPDLSAVLPRREIDALEVKRRVGCDKGMRDQLAQGDVDGLVRVPGNGAEPLVVVTLTKFRAVLIEAGYDVDVLPDNTESQAAA